MHITNKIRDWLLPTAFVLFLLEIILFPFAIQLTYAGRRESPNHVLTYTTNKLTWDSATGVDADTGVAELSLFSSTYQNVEGENGERIVAPGTEGTNVVRLKNDADKDIIYIAVMYCEKEEPTLPVVPALADSASFIDTQTYPLPKGVTAEQVVRAVTGSVKAGQMQDFDIAWSWGYSISDARDVVDTSLGNRAAWETADDVTAGLYIVVDEDTSTDPTDPSNPDNPDHPYTCPDVPQTGDTSNIMFYLVLMTISGLLLLLLLLERRKEKQ